MRVLEMVGKMMGRASVESKASRSGPMIAWSQVGRAKWTPRRYDQLAEEGYRKNVVAFRCVSMISQAAASVPFLVYDKKGHEMEEHPFLSLLTRPNPLQDGVAFMEAIYANLLIAGNAYIEAVEPRYGAGPRELYVLRSDRMKVVVGDNGMPVGYEYAVNGRSMRWEADPLTGESAILHIKMFHPLDDWYGMAPLEAAMMSIDQHNAAGAWNQALLHQGARPSGALVFAPKHGPSSLSDDQMQRLRDELEQHYQGRGNAGRPLILEGGLEWREMSLSPKDMDWLAGRDVAARDIALAFGVPAQLVGIPDAQTFSNMAEARLAFYEETVLPMVARVIGALGHWLQGMVRDGADLAFDVDDVSALAVRRDAVWEKVGRADFLTLNEKREALGYAPVAGGDTLNGRRKDEKKKQES